MQYAPTSYRRSRRFIIGVYINDLAHRLQIGASGERANYQEIAGQARNDERPLEGGQPRARATARVAPTVVMFSLQEILMRRAYFL